MVLLVVLIVFLKAQLSWDTPSSLSVSMSQEIRQELPTWGRSSWSCFLVFTFLGLTRHLRFRLEKRGVYWGGWAQASLSNLYFTRQSCTREDLGTCHAINRVVMCFLFGFGPFHLASLVGNSPRKKGEMRKGIWALLDPLAMKAF